MTSNSILSTTAPACNWPHRHTVWLCPDCDASTITDHRWIGGRGNVWMLVCCGEPEHWFELSTRRQLHNGSEWVDWDVLRRAETEVAP